MNKIPTRKEIEEIKPYCLGKSLEEIKSDYNLTNIRKMSDNENVYGCSSYVKKALRDSLSQLYTYPDGTTSTLKGKLSKFYNVQEDCFIIGNGSEEIIRLLTRAYINHGNEAIMADITFPRYETNVVIEGGIPIKVPLNEGVHDLEEMYKVVTKNTKMVFVCNPNNPTGTIVGKKELYEFISKIPSDVLVVIDEAYYEYVLTDDYLETVPLLQEFPNLIILRTFSKIYGLAGLRVGYGIMANDIIQELTKVKDVFNVNQLAQNAASFALEDQEFVNDCASRNSVERDYVSNELATLGLTSYQSESNFLFVIIPKPVSSLLLEKGIVVRGFKMTESKEALRVTLGTREDNQAFITLLRQLVKESVV